MECPELVRRLRIRHAAAVERGDKTVISGELIDIDFAASTISYGGEEFAFPALGSVPQSLVIAGGIENLVRQKLQSAVGSGV